MSKLNKLLGHARGHLDSDEQIVEAIQGTYETKIMGSDSVRTGSLLATDRRLVFFAKKLTGYDLESFPYENISSIECGKNMMGGKVAFFASGNKVEMKWINSGDLQRFVAYVQSRMGRPGSAARPSGEDDPVAQIRKLGELRDAGLLSDDEFAAKKAQILDRM